MDGALRHRVCPDRGPVRPGGTRRQARAYLLGLLADVETRSCWRRWSARPVPLRVLVQVAGTRWCVETCFQTGKGLGLDEHQVRRRNSWYRHTTLVMLAHAILTVIAAHERAHQRPEEQKLVPLSINEIRRLLAKLAINTAHTIDHWLGWSTWRRRHQARAKTSHYRRRGHFEHRPAPT